MNKFLILLVSVFLLTSCFGGDDNEVKIEQKSQTGLQLYSTGSFSIAIPTAWSKYKDDSKLLPKPIFGKVVLATVSKENKLGFYNNFVILSQELGTEINSYEYSKINNFMSQKDYLEYKELTNKRITFIDGDKGNLYVFEARYNDKSPKAIFIQTGKVCDETGYLLTIGLNQSIGKTDKYQKIVETFKCNTKNKK